MHFWKAGFALLACGTAVQAALSDNINTVTADLVKLSDDLAALSVPPSFTQISTIITDVTETALDIVTLVANLPNSGDIGTAIDALKHLCDQLPTVATNLVTTLNTLTGVVGTLLKVTLQLEVTALSQVLELLLTALGNLTPSGPLNDVIGCVTDAINTLQAVAGGAKMVRSAGATIPVRVPIAAF